MEFWVTPSFCLRELMFSLGRENTLWDVVCLGWAAKLNAALRWIVIPFFLWRDFCQFEKGGGFPFPASLPNLSGFLQGRRGERWLDSLALIIPGLILSACVYLKRTASHLPCGRSRTSSRGYKGGGQPSRVCTNCMPRQWGRRGGCLF